MNQQMKNRKTIEKIMKSKTQCMINYKSKSIWHSTHTVVYVGGHILKSMFLFFHSIHWSVFLLKSKKSFFAMRTKNASLQNRLLFFPREERFDIVGNKSTIVDKFQFLQGQKYECFDTPLCQWSYKSTSEGIARSFFYKEGSRRYLIFLTVS